MSVRHITAVVMTVITVLAGCGQSQVPSKQAAGLPAEQVVGSTLVKINEEQKKYLEKAPEKDFVAAVCPMNVEKKEFENDRVLPYLWAACGQAVAKEFTRSTNIPSVMKGTVSRAEVQDILESAPVPASMLARLEKAMKAKKV